MWRCPKCDEEIDDRFDACWHCGTAQDGTPDLDFHAGAGDPAVPDRGPESEPPPEDEEKAEGNRILHERLVEICSAGNIVEADCLCEMLEEAGIQARVVGDNLSAAAGCLPLGEATSPRLWVRESDADRARQIVEQWRNEQEDALPEPPECGEPPAVDVPVESQETALPTDTKLRFLGQGLFVVAIICLAAGAIWAWRNWTELSKHSATTEATFVWIGDPQVKLVFPPPRDPNLPLQPSAPRVLAVRHSFGANYTYTVDGESYPAYLSVDGADEIPEHVQIRYDPRHPAAHIVGSIAPPWMLLLFSFAIAAFLSFVGWQFR
jgi:hypothetical protein